MDLLGVAAARQSAAGNAGKFWRRRDAATGVKIGLGWASMFRVFERQQ
jgi:hypothetical protein